MSHGHHSCGCRCVVIHDGKVVSKTSLLVSHEVSSAKSLRFSVAIGHLLKALSWKYNIAEFRKLTAPPPIRHTVVVDEHGTISSFRTCFITGWPIIYRVTDLKINGLVNDCCFIFRLAAALHAITVNDGMFGVVYNNNGMLNQYGLKPTAIKDIPYLKVKVAYYAVSDLPEPEIVATLSFEEAYRLAREAKEARRRSRVKIYPSEVTNT